MSSTSTNRPQPTNGAGSTRRDTGFESSAGATRWAWLAFDLLALLAAGVLLTLVLYPTFGPGWLPVSALGGVVVGAVIAHQAWQWRLGVGRVALALVAAWFVLGGPLAMPSSLHGIVPTGRTIRGLAEAPLTVWKAMLTFDPPIGETGNLLCAPLALGLLTGLGGGLVSLRTRRPQLAWLPAAAAVGLAAVLGTGRGIHPVALAIASSVLALVWSTHRLATLRRLLVRRGAAHDGGLRPGVALGLLNPLLGLVVLLLASGATLLAAPALRPGSDPRTLRSVVTQPLDLADPPSPLMAFRANVQPGRRDQVLLRTQGEIPRGAVVRLAALDEFDGLDYGLSNAGDGAAQQGQFRRVGSRIVQPEQGQTVEVTVQVDALGGNWLPTIGQASRVRFEGPRADELTETFYYNKATGTGFTSTALRPGDGYRLTGQLAPRPSEQAIAAARAGQLAVPAPRMVPDLAGELAKLWAGNATGGRAAQRIEQALRQGYFSHGTADEVPSASGHSAVRVAELLERSRLNPSSMVGDEEQYATAMALMSSTLGIPARVVYGYRADGSGVVRGAQVGAWPELYLDGLGWVLFDPTPPHDRTLAKLPPENPPAPNKRVDDPPPRPDPPQTPPLDTSLPTDEAQAPRRLPQIPWADVGKWSAIFGVPLVFVVAPLLAVLLVKRRRRTSRRAAPVVANRLAGAWSEVVDRARDLGASPSPAGTRSEQAEQLVVAFPKLVEGSDPIGLAKQVDAGVFRPEPVSPDQADQVWQRSGGLLGALRRVLGRGRWLRSTISTRSLRRYR